MVPPCSVKVSRAPTYSLSFWVFFQIQGYHLLWQAFPNLSSRNPKTLGLFPFRSPLLRESQLISFPSGTKMFQFPEYTLYAYVFSIQYLASKVGFPIRKSSDQNLCANFPRLIASFYVLHRYRLPRHPPYALCSLIT